MRLHAHLVEPDLGSLIVRFVDGEPQELGVHAKSFGDQLISPRDGILFEIVAEAEIPEHFKETGVPGGRADDVDVDSPHTLLRRDGSIPRRLLFPEKIRLERHHAGIVEQQRRINRNQRCRRSHDVGSFFEEFQKGGAKSIGIHGYNRLVAGKLQPRPLGVRNRVPAPSRASATDSTAERRRLAGVRAWRARASFAANRADPPMPAATPNKNHRERLNMKGRVTSFQFPVTSKAEIHEPF